MGKRKEYVTNKSQIHHYEKLPQACSKLPYIKDLQKRQGKENNGRKQERKLQKNMQNHSKILSNEEIIYKLQV